MQNHRTILGQMLQLFSRYEFDKAVSETGTEVHARGFRSWHCFVALLFGQLSCQDSLRGIEAGLASQFQRLYHLGIAPVHRSPLAYANEHRTHQLFKRIFEAMLSKCQALAPKHPFRFKNPLYTLSSILPTNLFVKRPLWDWLNAPFKAPEPVSPGVVPYELAFASFGQL